ncbi:MAG: type II toxin-antitoxin system HicB family antitoxin [Armatimonadetes bacterium]|nr:type II toxin-antitoxin system HicB family antitoxin [Armatimonadota bacterium]
MSRVYTVALLREDEGGYAVVVPALPGCVTQGPTLAEALERVKEAIAGYLETLEAHGEAVPEDSPTVTFDLDDAKEALVTRVAVGEAVPVA